MTTRRQFNIGLGALAFAGLTGCGLGKPDRFQTMKTSAGFGALQPDPAKLLDLPPGFSYQVISQLGDTMSDGFAVPDAADGMGCLPLDDERVVLIRNHELKPSDLSDQPESIRTHITDRAYDRFVATGVALPGGNSNIIYNLTTQKVEKQFLTLVGTYRNCAGGITPWGSWLSCEESVATPDGEIGQSHGYIFEIPASATGLVEPVALKAMGRFNHEAAAVDPVTGIVYLTEDRSDSLFYRFIPKVPGKLEQGGQLQALVVKNSPKFDTRNWNESAMPVNGWFETEWITLDNPESPEDDLRARGYQQGAALFARGEGIHWGENETYFCCTNGGSGKYGQVMRYQPSPYEGTDKENQQPGKLQLFFESESGDFYNYGDNLAVTPFNHLLICEDQYTAIVDNHLRGITPKGEVYDFARIRVQTEPAGACFSPDGSTLFVNLYSPAKTLAIRGPWDKFA